MRSIAQQLNAILKLKLGEVSDIDYSDIRLWKSRVGSSTSVGDVLDDKVIERIDQIYRDNFN